MIKCERKTLETIKKNFDLDRIIYLDTERNLFIANEIQISYKDKSMPYIIKSLANQGYLSLHNHPVDIYFSLSYEGYNRFKFQIDSFKRSFLTKWIPGFISGVVTAFVAELLIYSFL